MCLSSYYELTDSLLFTALLVWVKFMQSNHATHWQKVTSYLPIVPA
ncbi:hypothetical protein THZB04_10411 [Vibrio owensii]|nr:hypothetical protein THZB04_10411 [Vibrio owensii]